MGQKVSPICFRLGVIVPFRATWFAACKTVYAEYLHSDYKIREYFTKIIPRTSIAKILIDRFPNVVRITIFTSRPAIVIGKKGENLEKLRKGVADVIGLLANSVHIKVEEVRKPELDAKLAADNIAEQLERRVAFRRAMKKVMQNALRAGNAKGVKVQVSGRLGGAEIARTEQYREGKVPLHTLRADIDYSHAEARTTYGIIGIKVWIYKGEVLENRLQGHSIAQLEKPELPKKTPRKSQKFSKEVK